MKHAAEKRPPGAHGKLHGRAAMVGQDLNKAAGHHRVGWLDYCVPIGGWGKAAWGGGGLRCCACRCF